MIDDIVFFFFFFTLIDYTYAEKDTVSAKVTFRVANGSWNDGTAKEKTVTLTGYEGDQLKLAKRDIPAAGKKPAKNTGSGQ